MTVKPVKKEFPERDNKFQFNSIVTMFSRHTMLILELKISFKFV